MDARRLVVGLALALLLAGSLGAAAVERDAALALAGRVAPGDHPAVVTIDGRTDFPAASARAMLAAVPGSRAAFAYRGEVQIAGVGYTLVGLEGVDLPRGTAAPVSTAARPLSDHDGELELLALRRVLPPVTTLHEMEFLQACGEPRFTAEREVCRDDAAIAAENLTVLRVSIPRDARRLAFHADVRELRRDERPAGWNGTFEDPDGRVAAAFSLEVPRGATALPPPFALDGAPTLAPGTWTVRFALEANGTRLPGVAGVVAVDAPRPGAAAPDARSPVSVVPGRLSFAPPATPPEAARDADLVASLETAQALFGARGRITEARVVETAPGAPAALAEEALEEAARSLADGPSRDVAREALSVRDLEGHRETARVEALEAWTRRATEAAPAVLAAALALALLLVPFPRKISRRLPLAVAAGTALLALAWVLLPSFSFALAPLVALGGGVAIAVGARATPREAGAAGLAAAAFAVVLAGAVVSASAAAASGRVSEQAYEITDAGPWRAVRLPDDAVVRLDGSPRPAGVVVLGAESRLAPDLPPLFEASQTFRSTMEVFEVLPTSPRAAVVTEPLTRAPDGTPGAHGVGSTLVIPGAGGDVEFLVVGVLDARAPSAVFVAPSNLDALFGGAASAGFVPVSLAAPGAEPPGPPVAAVAAGAVAAFALGAATRGARTLAAAFAPALALGAVAGLGAWRETATARAAGAGLAFDAGAALVAGVALAGLVALGRFVARRV